MGSGQPLKVLRRKWVWHRSVPLVLYSDPQENCLELIKADAASRPDSGQEAWLGLGSWRWLQRSG